MSWLEITHSNVFTLSVALDLTNHRIQAYLKNDYEKALYWNLDRIGMPESLKEQKYAVIELILEAFRAYGYLYRNQNHAPDTIFFTDVADPSFYKEEK